MNRKKRIFAIDLGAAGYFYKKGCVLCKVEQQYFDYIKSNIFRMYFLDPVPGRDLMSEYDRSQKTTDLKTIVCFLEMLTEYLRRTSHKQSPPKTQPVFIPQGGIL